MLICKRKPSLRARFMNSVLKRKTSKNFTEAPIDFPRTRKTMEKQNAGRKHSKYVCVDQIDANGVKGEWQVPKDTSKNKVIYYVHGGGYTIGSPESHRVMTAALAEMSGFSVFSLDYRLSPEHKFPAPIDDAFNAYRWLLAEGLSPQDIIFVGDSAGGGLLLSLMLKLKSLGETLPNAAVLFSPWTDLTLSGGSVAQNKKSCSMLNDLILESCTAAYLDGEDPNNILVSPLLGDLSGLPPLLIYASSSEMLLDDSVRLAEKAKKSEVDVTLNIWQKQPHAWQIFYPFIPEAKRCLLEVAEFIKHRWA